MIGLQTSRLTHVVSAYVGGASYSPSDSVVGTVFVFASRNIMRSALLTVVYETSEISGLGPLLH